MGIVDARTPVSHDPAMHAQLLALGAAPPEPVQGQPGDICEVLPANWPSVMAWLDCETQWRAVAGRAGIIWLGLDYQAVDVVLRRTAAPDGVFADLQLMERIALDVMSEASR